jgi:cytosine/adenosine deaminase-related metal-dependent hydrolase
MKKLYKASLLLPLNAPAIKNGAMLVENNTILEVGEYHTFNKKNIRHIIEFPHSVITPSFINAHTHLELSWMKGKIPAGKSFAGWVEKMIQYQNKTPADNEVRQYAVEQMELMRSAGVILAADITNGQLIKKLEAKRGVKRIVQLEKLGFNSEKAESILEAAIQQKEKCNHEALVVPHAPYSTSPQLIQKIKNYNSKISIHIAESKDEKEFMSAGGGKFRDILESVGSWDEKWTVPRMGSIEYLHHLGVLDSDTILVHAVHINPTEIDFIKSANSSVCLCPLSNHYLNVGTAPAYELWKAGVLLCMGTDSLASNAKLDMNEEMKYLYLENEKRIPADEILKMATLNGAKALGCESSFGSLTAGKQASFNVFGGYGLTDDPAEFVVRKKWSKIDCY